MDTKGWLTADHAAELLGIKRRSVYDFAKRLSGFPQPTKIGRTVLWREEALKEWRDAHPARRANVG